MNASRSLFAALLAGSLGGCVGMTTVLDGPAGFDAFNRVGDAAWEVKDAKFPPGPFALQWGHGTIKFRKVQIRPL